MLSLKNFKPHILVIGDLMIDHYLWGECERISPEAPVQVVDVKKETSVLGGAGNVINNLLSLGAKVDVLSVIGDDEAGKEIRNMLLEKGVKDNMLIVQKNRKTSKKSRVLASHQQVIRFDKESKDEISGMSEVMLFKLFEENVKKYDIILMSDYKKGVLTELLCSKIIKTANKNDKKILIDPKGEDYSKYKNAYLITPNKKEAQIASKITIDSDEDLESAGFKLKNELRLDACVITLSEEGMAIFEDDMQKIPTVAKEVYDVTGAGDTVLATLGFVLAHKKSLQDAAKIANYAAAVVVGKLGSATVSVDEIIEYESSLHHNAISHKIKTFETIKNSVQNLKSKNKKIVFTNGCFDILHRGHIEYLMKSKSLGDVLVVGLNSDSSVKKLKGNSRPIVNEDDRAYILSALSFVDFVVIFEEDTPYELIKIIKPDILTKGADYKNKEVIGSDIAKEVKLINFVDGKSTTKTIQKIKEANG